MIRLASTTSRGWTGNRGPAFTFSVDELAYPFRQLCHRHGRHVVVDFSSACTGTASSLSGDDGTTGASLWIGDVEFETNEQFPVTCKVTGINYR
jgi:hypothetical protein